MTYLIDVAAITAVSEPAERRWQSVDHAQEVALAGHTVRLRGSHRSFTLMPDLPQSILRLLLGVLASGLLTGTHSYLNARR